MSSLINVYKFIHDNGIVIWKWKMTIFEILYK